MLNIEDNKEFHTFISLKTKVGVEEFNQTRSLLSPDSEPDYY